MFGRERVAIPGGVGEGGCSAKLGRKDLANLLQSINYPVDENVLVGLEEGDDAGVYRLPGQEALVVTTDFFPPPLDDSYLYGQIAVANAISDIYAMGARPLLGVNITIFPNTGEWGPSLREVLQGGADKAREAGMAVIGGHTIAGERPVYGMAVVGLVDPESMFTNGGLQVGDELILTKGIGTATLLSGFRQGIATPRELQIAVASMLQLNAYAVPILKKAGVRAVTDVTGFSLLGHLARMAQESHVGIELSFPHIPLLEGLVRLILAGCIPGSTFRNLEDSGRGWAFGSHLSAWHRYALCDAQTSGGLLFGVAPDKVESVLESLRAAGYHTASRIGRVLDATQGLAVR